MADHDLQDDRGYVWDDLDEYSEGPVFARMNLEIKPAPVPWYRTGPAMFALGALGLALVAMVVAAVLLVSRDSLGPADVEPPLTPITSAQPTPSRTSTTPSPSTTSATPSPSPSSSSEPPPPPASQPASPPDSDGPEINVTRTPVTRSPISVQPTVPPAHPHY